MVKVTIKGERELIAALRRVGDSVRGDALGTAAVAGMDEIINAAKPITPYKTGNLRRSEHTELEESTPTRAVAVGGTDVEYAWPVERRKPYLRPAWDAKQDDAVKVVGEVLARQIKRATGTGL